MLAGACFGQQQAEPEATSSITQENGPEPSSVERFVMPFNQWVEEKMQGSSILNPTSRQQSQTIESKPGISLRQAIEQARNIQPGTVLSAERIETNGQLSYRIKILSEAGVVRMVMIPEEQP